MNKSKAIVGKYYDDTPIQINGYFFYDDVVNSWEKVQPWSHQMNADSMFRLFENSLSKLKVNGIVEEGNYAILDSSFRGNWTKPFDRLQTAKIISLSRDKDSLQLIPLLKMTHGYRNGMYFTSAGAVGGSRYTMRNDLDLIVYILKNDSIIYSRSAMVLGFEYPASDVMDIQHTLTQQDWDELVALVMKDYVDRVKDDSVNENFD